MKMTAIEAIPFSIPLRETTAFAHASISTADHVLVRVHTDEGVVGQAEAPARPFTYGESQESIVTAIERWIAPALMGRDPMARETVREQLSWLVHNHTARAAVDMAVWDIIGQALHQPVHRLLGGYTSSMKVAHIVFARSPEGMVEEATAMRERFGFGCFKIKTGKDPKGDAKAVTTLRTELGDDVELYIDSNKGWSADQALALLPVLQEAGISMLEEPTPALEPLGRRRLAGHTTIPILGDESVTRLGDIATQILDNHAHMISIKTARTGFTESERIVGLCEGLGVGMVMGSQMDGAVGTLGTLAFGAAHRSTSARAAELGYFLHLTDDIVTEVPVIEGGHMRVPEAPGVGISIDEDKLAHYRVDN